MRDGITFFEAIANRLKGIFSPRLGLIALDAFMGGIAFLCVIRWRYDFLNKPVAVDIDLKAATLMSICVLSIWIVMRQDRVIWKFTSLKDFQRLFTGVVIACGTVPYRAYRYERKKCRPANS